MQSLAVTIKCLNGSSSQAAVVNMSDYVGCVGCVAAIHYHISLSLRISTLCFSFQAYVVIIIINNILPTVPSQLCLAVPSVSASAAHAATGASPSAAKVTATVVAAAAAVKAGAAKDAGKAVSEAVRKFLSPPPVGKVTHNAGGKGRRALALSLLGWLGGVAARRH